MTVSPGLWSAGTLGSRSQTGPPDEFGTPTWVEVSTPIRAVAFPRSSEELAEAGGGGISRWIGFYIPADGSDPAGLVADAGDRITLHDGRVFEIVGPGRDWFNPRTKTTPFVQVDIEKVDR